MTKIVSIPSGVRAIDFIGPSPGPTYRMRVSYRLRPDKKTFEIDKAWWSNTKSEVKGYEGEFIDILRNLTGAWSAPVVDTLADTG